MRVTYRWCDSRPNGTPIYEAVAVRFCCGEMERHWGKFIGLGIPGHRRSANRQVNLASTLTQRGTSPAIALIPVQFCPWCGEPVETSRAE